MKEVQTSGDYVIYEKRSGRYAVKGTDKKYVNGDDKAKILADAGLVTIPEPKAAPVDETPAEEAAADESPAEDNATEEETPTEDSSEEKSDN
ncbi:MAG: hypothetical protein AAF372_01170 [Pseudomonadota bacterium]